MRKPLLLIGVVLLSIFGFTACEKEDVDNEKPLIRLLSPSEGELVKPGSDIHFEMELSDNVGLASYKVNIHGAFDGHNHGTRSTSDSIEFSKTWLESDFIALGEEPIAGKRNVTVHHHYIEIPATISRNIDGEVVEAPIKEGTYHFIVYCTDDSGQESFVSTEIHISYDAEEHDHH